MKLQLYLFLAFTCTSSLLFAQTPLNQEEGEVLRLDTPLYLQQSIMELGSRAETITLPAGDEVEGDYLAEIKFTPDGESVWVLNRTTDNITVFNWSDQSIQANIEVGGQPVDVAFSDDFAVVACNGSQEVYLIDLSDFSTAAVFATAGSPAKVRVSRDGSLAVVGCDEPDVAEVFDLNSLTAVTTIPDFPVYLYKFSFITSNPRNTIYYSGFEISPDNQYLINGSDEQGLRFYEIATGAVTATIPEAGNTGQVALSGDGSTLVAVQSGSDALVLSIDVESQSLLHQVAVTGQNLFSSYSSPAVNMDGTRVLVAANPGNTALIDLPNETFVTVATGNTPDWVGQSADYQYAIAGDFYLAVIDFETGNIVSSLNGTSIQSGAVSPANNRLVATDALRYEGVLFYEFENPAQLEQINYQLSGSELEGDATYSVRVTQDGSKVLAVNVLSGTLSVYDVATETLSGIIDLGSPETYQVDVTSDNRYALIAKRLTNTVAIVDLETLEVVADVPSGGQKPDQVFILPGDERAYVMNAGSPDLMGVIQLDGANSFLSSTFFIGNTGISWTNYGIRADLQFDHTGNFAYVANPFDNQVQVVNLATNDVVNELPVADFPLQIAAGTPTSLGTFTAVTQKNGGAISIISGTGSISNVAGAFSCGPNPTRLAYNIQDESFYVISNDEKDIKVFSLEALSFVDEIDYTVHTPLAIKFSESGSSFVVLRSDDTDVSPHYLEIDGDLYELPGLPMQHFDVNPTGTVAAVALPVNDEVVIYKGDPILGWKQLRFPANQACFQLQPNPVSSELRFVPKGQWTGSARLSIYHTDGKLLHEQAVQLGEELLLERSTTWLPGAYWYQVQQGGQVLQSGQVLLK